MGTCSKDHKSAAGHVRITGVWHQAWLLTAIPQPKRWHVYQAGLHHLFGSEEVKHIYGCHVGRAQKSLENPNCPNISLFWAFMCHGRTPSLSVFLERDAAQPRHGHACSQPASQAMQQAAPSAWAAHGISIDASETREPFLDTVFRAGGRTGAGAHAVPPITFAFPSGPAAVYCTSCPPLPFQLRRAGCRGTRAVCSPRPHAAIEFTLSGP